MASYLVTGGAGFIGSHVVRTLAAGGERIRVLDDLSTGTLANIEGVEGVEFMRGDVRDPAACAEAVRDVDYVIHMAAIRSIPRSLDDPRLSHDVNAGGTLNLLEAVRSRPVRRFVYASSSSVYGKPPSLPMREGDPCMPVSPYAVSKYAGELYCRGFHEIFGVPVVCLRFFNVFGPGQEDRSRYSAVIPAFFRAMLRGERPVIYGDGEQTRDFTFVENTVSGVLKACRAGGESVGGVFNVAAGTRVSVNEIFRRIRDILGAAVEPVYRDARPGETRHTLASIEKAESVLGYRVLVDVREGLERTAAWYVKMSGEGSSIGVA